jgi:hypothetical protein
MQSSDKIQQLPYQGASMDPMFKRASSVWIDFSKSQCPRVGDVLVYYDLDQKFVCHRVVGIANDGFVVIGDNCLWLEHVPHEDYWGRVVAFERDGQRHALQNHILLRPYCWMQKRLHSINSLFIRRSARKIARGYLRLMELF